MTHTLRPRTHLEAREFTQREEVRKAERIENAALEHPAVQQLAADNARLTAELATHAPHICGDDACPGNRLRFRLEAADRLAHTVEVAKRNRAVNALYGVPLFDALAAYAAAVESAQDAYDAAE